MEGDTHSCLSVATKLARALLTALRMALMPLTMLALADDVAERVIPAVLASVPDALLETERTADVPLTSDATEAGAAAKLRTHVIERVMAAAAAEVAVRVI
jgi:hypothetical protein